MEEVLAKKQIEFIRNSKATINLAHGSVRSGKTMGTAHRFMQAAYECPDSDIWMIGHTSSTIYDNVINLILTKPAPGFPDPLAIYRPFCSWHDSKRALLFGTKKINTLGVKDKGAYGLIMGKTFSLCYCDEMTLYDDVIIDAINSRLSRPHSKLFASMNPTYPTHKLKQWIDWAREGDKRYYELHFTVDDNPFLGEEYKNDLKKSLSGVFYKRNYLGQWCLAEGAIFDFFDKSHHVRSAAPSFGEYWIAGVDFGISNAFACVLVGINTGKNTQSDYQWWVEKELYWDSKKMGRQKLSFELAEEVKQFLEPYGVKNVYVDPSALDFKEQLQRKGLHVVKANNDVSYGIQKMTSEMKDGSLTIVKDCKNLIREVEGYVWDSKKGEKGEDAPLKQDDHAIDALRYAIATHKISNFDGYEHARKMQQQMQMNMQNDPRNFRR